jgi:predicted HTH transcriptional regulator
MESEELASLMKLIEEKGIGWDKVEEKMKISHDLLKLYVNSGPVPVTIINGLKKILEEPPQ